MEKSKNRILFIVATQYDNLGDLLINKCLLMMLSKYGKVYLETKKVPEKFKNSLLEVSPNIVDLNAEFNVSVKGIGMLSIPFKKELSFTHVFKSPGPFGANSSTLDKIRSWGFYCMFYLFKIKKGKVFFVGNNFIIKNNFDKKILKRFETVLAGIFVRSEKNVMEIITSGIHKVGYIPDMCFAMQMDSTNDIRSKIGISFRNLENKVWDIELKKYLKIILSFYTNENKEVEFFYQVNRDYDYNNKLFNYFIKDFPNIKFRDKLIEWEDLDYYSDKEFVISNRLHVLLLGQKYLAIPIAILNDSDKTSKINDIFETINLNSLIFYKITKNDLNSIKKDYQNLFETILDINQKQFSLIELRFNEMFQLN